MITLSSFNDLKERIRSDLADRIPVTFLDEELFKFTIEGAELIYDYVAQAQPRLLETKYSATVLKGEYEIDLPSDIMLLGDIWVSDSSGMMYKVVRVGKRTTLLYTSTFGIPKYATVYGTKLVIAPKPSSDIITYLYYVPVYTPPTTFDDDIGLNPMFDMMVVEYAIIRAHNRNARQPVVEQQFFNLKSETLRQILNRMGDEKITMKKTMYEDYWDTSW